MQLCEKCRVGLAEPGSETRFPFPCTTVAGGALGAAAAAVTGTLVLVPLALLAGAVLDASRCDRCGEAIEEADPRYATMEAGEENGEPTFTPFDLPRKQNEAEESFSSDRHFDTPLSPPSRQGKWEVPSSPDTYGLEGQPPSQPGQVRYKYDVVAEKLVPTAAPKTEEEHTTEYGFSIVAEPYSTDWQFIWPEVTPDSLPDPGPVAGGTEGGSCPPDIGEPKAGSEGGERI